MIQRLVDGNWTTGLWYQAYLCSSNQCSVGLMLKSQFDCYSFWKPFVPGRRQVRYCDKKTSSLFWHFCNFLPKFCRKYFVSDISKGGVGTKIVTGSSQKKLGQVLFRGDTFLAKKWKLFDLIFMKLTSKFWASDSYKMVSTRSADLNNSF